jgi:hypothetical protein
MSRKKTRLLLIVFIPLLILYSVSFGLFCRYGDIFPGTLWHIINAFYLPHYAVLAHVPAYHNYIVECDLSSLSGGVEFPPHWRYGKSICNKKSNTCGCAPISEDDKRIYTCVLDSLFGSKNAVIKICDTAMIENRYASANIYKRPDRPPGIKKNVLKTLSLVNCCRCPISNMDLAIKLPYTFCNFRDFPTADIYDTIQIRNKSKTGIPEKIAVDTMYIVLSRVAIMKDKLNASVYMRKYRWRSDCFSEYIIQIKRTPLNWSIKAIWQLRDWNPQMVKL